MIRISLLMVGLATSLTVFPVCAEEHVSQGRVSSSLWGISFVAPAYEVWSDHPLRGRPDFVAAGEWDAQGCSFHLSLFAVLVDAGTSPAECRSGFAGNPVPLASERDVTVLATEDKPVAWTHFDQKSAGLVQNQLYGYWVRDETCFELHVSAMSCEHFGSVTLPILKSVALEPRPDVNVETVAVGRSVGLRPNHWRVHLTLAGEYLHNAQPANPTRARHYYENALRLSQGDLPFEDAWTLYEGIGLSWLEEDNGDAAIDPLSQAVELARSASAAEELWESLYNLACAYSLAGEVESACAIAAESLTTRPPKGRRQSLNEMRNDPQLRTLVEARCVEGLE